MVILISLMLPVIAVVSLWVCGVKKSAECFYCVDELGFGMFIFDLLNALCVNIELFWFGGIMRFSIV